MEDNCAGRALNVCILLCIKRSDRKNQVEYGSAGSGCAGEATAARIHEGCRGGTLIGLFPSSDGTTSASPLLEDGISYV